MPYKSGATVNDSFFPGHHHIPQISNCIIKAQFSLSHDLADISNFYTNLQLDEQGALLPAVLLQTPAEDSKYPTLDPNRDVPLQLFVFVGAIFGYKDSGSLAGLAKTLIMDPKKTILQLTISRASCTLDSR